MTKNAKIDEFDRKILKVVQANNQLTHSEIGQRIGMSPSSVRRRLTALRENGTIVADISCVDPNAFGVTLFVTVTFAEETRDVYDAFDKQMQSLPPVKQSYHVAGDSDYMLVVNGPSLQWYEDWAKEVFMTNKAIRRYSTVVAWACKKFDISTEV